MYRDININTFDLNNIKDDSTILLIAKRNSGKSWLVRDIIYTKNKSNIPAIVCIAPTDKLNHFYSDFIPDSYIYYSYNGHILEKIFKRQESLIKENNERKKQNKKLIDPRLILIMDDCLSTKSTWAKDQNITEMLQNGRHYHITFILTMQYSLGISPDLRSQFDLVFLLSEDFITNQKRLFEHYCGYFKTFDEFRKIFNRITEDYGTLVINTQSREKEIEKKLFWYKAKPITNFKFGSKQFIDFHKKNFDKNWSKEKSNVVQINDNTFLKLKNT